MKKYDILIIGGGAAGLAAAVSAKWENRDVSVCIIEKNDRIARKIHATGNGRCNFTNMDIRGKYFFGQRDFVEKVLNTFGSDDALKFFEKLGVKHRVEDGRVYPASNQAGAVADALRLYVTEAGVDIVLGKSVNEIKKIKSVFKTGDIEAKNIIIATGGKASPALGSDGSGYKILKEFGHKITKVKPGLVSLKTNNEVTKVLKGVKVFGKVCLKDGNRIAAEEEGEILFTEYGISGIPVMQISRFAEKGMTLLVDMLPRCSKDEALGEIYLRVSSFPEREGGELFSGLVNKKVAIPMLKYAGVEKTTVKAKDFTDENVLKCGEFLKNLKLTVLGDNGFANAQVCAGGVELLDFDPYSMESKLVKNLFAAGEILDCDGICGGYNLHWAWATGYIAGTAAVRR